MQQKPQKHIDICFSPGLIEHYERENNLVVVVDLFRATTAITTALANGAKSVIPVADIKTAITYSKKGYLIAGERDGNQLDRFDFGNSPLEFTPEKIEGQNLAMTTTNGTQAFAATGEKHVIAASLLNYKAVMAYVMRQQKDVVFLCSGWTMKMNIEDSLLSGRFALDLLQDEQFYTDSDSIAIAKSLTEKANNNWHDYILASSPRLKRKYPKLKDDIRFALEENTTTVVPVLKEGHLVPHFEKN